MKRRTFIAGIGTTTTLFLAGCNSSGDDTGSTTTGTESSSTETSTTSTTTAGETTTDTTTTETTTTTTETSETTTTGTKTVTYGQYASISDGLEVAVTNADTADSYEHDGTTSNPDDGNTYVLLTFKTKNSGESSQSLPDDSSLAIRANGDEYTVADAGAKKWEEYVSSSVKPGSTASITVPFEASKDTNSALGASIVLSYTDSGSERTIRWGME